MAEDKLWDIDLLLGVHLDRDTTSVVVYRNRVVLYVDGDLDGIHGLVVNLKQCGSTAYTRCIRAL